MSSSAVYLNELGVICALGADRAQVREGLFAAQPGGLHDNDTLLPGRTLALGEVQAPLPDLVAQLNDFRPALLFGYAAAIAADPALAPNQALFGTNGVIFEGSAANTLETLLTAADPTVSDKTFLLPNIVGAIGTLISTGNLSQITATGIVTSGEWRGTRIAPLYGGTGIDTSGGSTSGVPVIDAGVWSVATSLAVAKGGTGATTAATARTNLGAAASGINSDISSILGLNQQVAIRIGSFSSGAGTGELQFVDLPGGGQFYVGLKAPDLVSANTTWSLPSADSAGCWQSDGAGVLSISTCPGGLGGGGLTNQIAKFTPDGATLGNSIISDNGTVATVAGDLTVAATETVTINGVGRTTWPNEAPIYTQTLFGATGDIPWRTTTASAQMVRQAYQPFAAGYGAMPSCPSGYTRKHGLYVEYVDNMTANPPPAPTGTPRVWLDSAVDDDPGDTMQWAMPLSWGGSPQIRKFTSPLFTDPGLGGNGVADHINVKTWIQTPLNGAYLELRKVEVRTFCQ